MKTQNYLALFLIALSLCYCAHLSPVCFAQEEATPTAETDTEANEETQPLKENQLEKIRQLKERVATKVAELKKTGKKAYFGEISKILSTSIFLTTKRGEAVVTTSEDTEIFSISLGKKKSLSLRDLSEGQEMLALGISLEEELPAKIIIVKKMPLIVGGKVTDVDQKEGTLTIKTPKNSQFVIDYEKTTQSKIFEAGTLVKSGFSKININDRVHIVAAENEEENRLTALRILVLPGKALGITEEKPSPTEEAPTPTLTPTSTPE